MRKTYKLDKDERAILDSIEQGQWKKADNADNLIKKFSHYAKNTLKKDQRISIRMANQDLLGIKAKAMDEGLPYQTLIASIVHKYLNGKLVVSRS